MLNVVIYLENLLTTMSGFPDNLSEDIDTST